MAVTTDEFGAVAGKIQRNAVEWRDSGEGDPAGEFPVVVFGQQDASRRIPLDPGPRRALARQHAQHQPGIGEQRQAARPAAGIAQPDPGDFDRVLARREQAQFLLQSLAMMAVAAVTETVTDFVRHRLRDRTGRQRPVPTVVLVAQVPGLAMRVQHRVVVPGGQPVLAAVLAPGATGAGLAGDKAKSRVGDHVAPGLRRQAQSTAGLRLESNDVFATVGAETAMAVPELERLLVERGFGHAHGGARRRRRGGLRRDPAG